MTLTRIKSTGKGRLNARLVIEGLDHCFVSSARMERAADSQGRPWVNGLVLDGMKIGASADLMRATLKGEALTAVVRDLDRIAGSRHGRVTRALWRSPTARSFLRADLSESATSMSVTDTTAFPSSGVVHVGTEAIAYSGKTSTSFTGLTRAWFQTIAQAHYVADGEGLADALVTDYPVGVEGRRAYLYLYGDGDLPTGNGTLRWRGVCASDVLWSGGACSIQIDPVTRLLDQPIGGKTLSRVGIRGIHYTGASPLEINVTDATNGLVGGAMVIGFYEDQHAFVEAVNTALGTAVALGGISLGTGASLTARATPDGWEVVYVAASSSPVCIIVGVKSDIDFPGDWVFGAGALIVPGSAYTPVASAVYRTTFASEIPRGTLGRRVTWERREIDEPPSLTATYNRLYLSGLAAPTDNDVIHVSLDGSDEEPVYSVRVYSVDEATRSIYVEPYPSFATLSARTSVEIGRHLATGDITDLVDTIALDAPELANAGLMPLIIGSDLSYTADLEDSIAGQPLAQGRGWYAFEGGRTLAEILAPELMVLGGYMRVTTDGGIEMARLAPGLPTDTAAFSVDDTASAEQSIERSANGVLGEVTYKMGYDPIEDEHDDRTITCRDVQSTSAVRTSLSLEVAQLSTSNGGYRRSDDWATIDRGAVIRMSMAAFGLFGMPTATVTLSLDARYMDARIGDIVRVSSAMLPDVSDGYSPIVDRVGVVVAHSLDLASGAVMLGVLLHTQRFSGYAPSFLIDSQTNTSGDTWSITLTLAGYTDSTDVADWLAAGDLVEAHRLDSGGVVTGTIDSVDGVDEVTVSFDSTWTPGAYEWHLRAQPSSSHDLDAPLASYAYVGNSSVRLEYADGDVDAQVFS